MRVGVCIPSFDHWWGWFGYDLAGLFMHTTRQRPEIELLRFMATGTWLPQLREKAVQAALRNQCDWVLFLDTDMRFPADALLQLLAHEKAVVAANYTTRKPPFHPVSVSSLGADQRRVYTEADSAGLEKVAATGMGVMLIHQEVLRAIPKPRFMMGFSKDDDEHVGEDLYFCQQITRAGWDIHIDHTLSHQVTHIGVVEFEAAHAVSTRNSAQAKAASGT